MSAASQLLASYGIAVSLTYAQTVLADNPTGYWRLGESSGTSATDTSGNGNTGTYGSTGGGSFNLGQTGLITGDAGTSVAFVPSAKVDVGGVAITGNISMEGWLSVGTFPANGVQAMLLARGYDGVTQPYYMRLYNNSGTMELHAGSFLLAGAIDAKVVVNVNAWSAGQRHHIVGVYDGTNWILYIDGSSAGTAAFAQGALTGTTNTYIAAERFSGSDTHFYDGKLQEVALYPTALSSSRVLAHYNKGV